MKEDIYNYIYDLISEQPEFSASKDLLDSLIEAIKNLEYVDITFIKIGDDRYHVSLWDLRLLNE